MQAVACSRSRFEYRASTPCYVHTLTKVFSVLCSWPLIAPAASVFFVGSWGNITAFDINGCLWGVFVSVSLPWRDSNLNSICSEHLIFFFFSWACHHSHKYLLPSHFDKAFPVWLSFKGVSEELMKKWVVKCSSCKAVFLLNWHLRKFVIYTGAVTGLKTTRAVGLQRADFSLGQWISKHDQGAER